MKQEHRAVVRGQRARFELDPSGQVTGQPQTIIDSQLPNPGPWSLTLTPVTTEPGAQFWSGLNLQPNPTFLTGAGGVFQGFWDLTWGGGGTTFRTDGAWPVVGRTFTFAGDVCRLDARVFFAPGEVGNPTALVLSAWLVPAEYSIPFWTEQGVFSVPLDVVPVPWGARLLRVLCNPSVETADIRFMNATGGLMLPELQAVGTAYREYVVPAGARAVRCSTPGAAFTHYVWEIFLG